jgi:hypothetical protein
MSHSAGTSLNFVKLKSTIGIQNRKATNAKEQVLNRELSMEKGNIKDNTIKN